MNAIKNFTTVHLQLNKANVLEVFNTLNEDLYLSVFDMITETNE